VTVQLNCMASLPVVRQESARRGETVTRTFADLTRQQIVEKKGSTLRIRNKTALKALALIQ
jgi:hypothetical protein